MLDGGALLQHIPWIRGATYHDLCSVYTDYVARKYGEAIIIFDGYGETSTKDMIHLRRKKGQAGVNVTFTEEMQLSMKKATFLANSMNKQRYINMFGSYPEKKKCKVYYPPGDADLLIVERAVELSTEMDMVLVGDDRSSCFTVLSC